MFLDLLFSRARRLFLKWWRRVVLMKLNVRRYEAKDACILISFAMSALTCSRRTCTSQQKSLFISSSKNKCKIHVNHLEIYCTHVLSAYPNQSVWLLRPVSWDHTEEPTESVSQLLRLLMAPSRIASSASGYRY